MIPNAAAPSVDEGTVAGIRNWLVFGSLAMVLPDFIVARV